jgi:hypothetical protein
MVEGQSSDNSEGQFHEPHTTSGKTDFTAFSVDGLCDKLKKNSVALSPQAKYTD